MTETVTVVTAPTVVQQTVAFRDVPVTIVDSSGQQVTTVLEFRTGLLTWIAVGAICLFGGLCLAFIPFFIDALKDVYHIHPTTGEVIGIYKRI